MALAFAAGVAGRAEAATERARITAGRSAVLVDKRELFLETVPEHGDGWIAFAKRWTGSASTVSEITKANRNARRPLAGVRYRVPYRFLTESARLSVIRALFPEDRPEAAGWTHRTRGESLESISEWFTGHRAAVVAVRAANPSVKARVAPGTVVRIPNEVVSPVFRYVAPPVAATPRAPETTAPAVAEARPGPAAADDAPKPAPPAARAPAAATPPGVAVVPVGPVEIETPTSLLTYGEDAEGAHAIYRLRAGEALYSSVVVRFTGRLAAEDVNALAAEIARRSDIPDVTDIPIGYAVKIPADLLLPEFLPAADPRRLEYEVEQALAARYKNAVEARGLAGVTVVLDAGHGGVDVGASMAGVWESLYVYDIAMRVKRALETHTRASVRLTTRDGSDWKILDRDVLPYSRGHAVLTTPPYPIADSVVGVNLRWYLANSLLRRAKADGGSDEKVVFVSLHADSLHASIRGATIYVADSAGSNGPFQKKGAAFSTRKEVREQPSVSFTAKQRQRSEGLSRELAADVIRSLRERELDIHPFQPVRDRIYRGRRAWVPAVLRYNAIPAKMLLEVCNLANSEDRKLLTTRAFRQRTAEAVVDGLLAYFRE